MSENLNNIESEIQDLRRRVETLQQEISELRDSIKEAIGGQRS